MKKEIYEITTEYMRDLKKLLKNNKISPYDIAHASFRKNNAYWIIKSVNKNDFIITYLCGDVKKFPCYTSLMKEVRRVNAEYKHLRRKYIKKYYKIVNTFTKHRIEMSRKRKSKSTIADRLTPEQVKTLASKI